MKKQKIGSLGVSKNKMGEVMSLPFSRMFAVMLGVLSIDLALAQSESENELLSSWKSLSINKVDSSNRLQLLSQSLGLKSSLSLGNVSVTSRNETAFIRIDLPPGESRTNVRTTATEITVFIDGMNVAEQDIGRSIDVSNKSALISRYSLDPSDGGADLVFELQQPVFQKSYSQSGNLFIDLKAKDNSGAESEVVVDESDVPAVTNSILNKQTEQISKVSQYSGRPTDRMTLSLQDVNIRQLLQIFAAQRGINMVVSDDVQGNISVELNDVPWEQALDIVLQSKNLGRRTQGGVIFVSPKAKLVQDEQELLEAKQRQDDLIPLVSDVIQLNYGSAIKIAEEFGKSGSDESSIVSKRGRIIADERTNSLIVRDLAANVERLKEIVETLDRPVKQVMIDARIVLASDDFSKQIGVKWGVGGSVGAANGDYQLGFSGTPTGASDIVGATGRSFSTLGNRLGVDLGANAVSTGASPASAAFSLLAKDFLLDLELSAMQAEGRGETLSNPRVVTTNGQEAVIRQGEQIPYATISESGTQTEFKDAVLELKVTPRITPSGQVLLDLSVKKDERGSDTDAGPAINSREVNTQVLVQDQNTVVLGGVFEKVSIQSLEKVPLLGDLPGIGKLFRRNGNSDTKFELLVFVTPTIMK